MLIDAHAHVIPDDLPDREDWPRLVGGELVTRTARVPAPSEYHDLATRLASQEAQGLGAEVISPLPQLIEHEAEASTFAELCAHVNAFVGRWCRAEPRRLFGLGIVPLQDVGLATEMLRDVRDAGLAGVEIGSHVRGRLAGSEEFLPFFREAQRLDLAVLMHALPPTSPPLSASAVPAYLMPAQIGLGAASVISGPLPEACPELRLAFSHGAGGLPLALPRAHYFWGGSWNRADPRVRPDHPSPLEVARRYWYDALVFDRVLLNYVVDVLGSDRLLLGSDYPATRREEPPFDTIVRSGMPEKEVAAVAWDNTFRWLGVPPPA
jgi:aminocarboxymuconate-semialdehyde decarboxylase